MPELDIRYLAGLFDGEGHITVTRNRAGQREYLTVGCGIANQYRPVLEQVKAQFGGNVYQQKPGERPVFAWIARSVEMTAFLEAVLPHLQIKRRQAELGIEFQRKMGARYDRVTVAEAARREAIRVELRLLNAKYRSN